ncbi:DUF6889 family protein [Escherichia coli]
MGNVGCRAYLLNDHLAVKADNQRRIEKWREDNER